jgi:hypothetical protein
LHGSEAQKIPASKQAKVSGLQLKLCNQSRRYRGSDRTDQGGQKVSEGERQKYGDRFIA